jgi:hypothetical protein
MDKHHSSLGNRFWTPPLIGFFSSGYQWAVVFDLWYLMSCRMRAIQVGAFTFRRLCKINGSLMGRVVVYFGA